MNNEKKKHPILRPYVDRADDAERRLAGLIADIEAIAADLPVKCGIIDAGMSCACTGLCHPKEYHALMDAIREAQKPNPAK